MGGVTYDYMERYIRDLIPENNDFLKELEEYANEYNVPIIQKEGAQFLKTIVAIKKPKKVLELGTAIGYSALTIYQSNKCKITTIDRSADMVAKARENIEKAGAQNDITVIEGDVLEVVKGLDEKFDLIFMDAGKGHYNHLLDDILRLLSEDGVIVADNVLFRGMVANDDLVIRRKITIVKRMRAYLEMINDRKELVTSIIPMGDGIALTTRRK